MLDIAVGMDAGDELLWEPLRVVPPDPWVGHIPFAFWLIKALRPATLVELGTHSGNSYFAFCQAMAAVAPTGRAFAVDSWAGDEHAGRYGEEVFADVTAFNTAHFRQFSTLLRTSFDDARSYFPDGSVDLLHIDGMHSYESVLHDFSNWQSALAPSAVVLFHDINVRERNFGVWRLWHELSAQYPSFAFDHSNGLGVLGVGGDQSEAMQALFALSRQPLSASAFRQRVAARGEAFQWQVRVKSIEAHHGELATQLHSAQAQAHAAATELERHRAEIAWQQALITVKGELVAAKDAQIVSLRGLAAARLASVAERDRIIELRDRQASQLQTDADHQRFMTSEERRVRLEMQEGYEAAIRGINQDRDLLRDQAQQQVEAAKQQVAAIYVTSTSWRMTRPLRVAIRLLRRGRFVPPPLPPSLLPLPPAISVPAEPADAKNGDSAAGDAMSAAKHAIRALFSARLEAFLSGTGRLQLPHAADPDVSIILVLYNQAELTFACLSSIVETLATAPFGVEIVIADNGSADQTAALLDRIDGAVILRNGANLHFLRAVNLAAGSARGRCILLLNNDAQLLPGALASALRTLEADPKIGAVGGRIILPDGTLQEAGSIIWQDGACSGYARGESPSNADVMFQRDVDYCSGAFLLTPAALFRGLGCFDDRFAPAYYEETDYCVRLWESGYRVVYDPDAVILHYEFGSSAGAKAMQLQAANHAVFTAQHEDFLSRQFPVSPKNVMSARRARSAAPRILMLEDRIPKHELGSGYPRANLLAHELVNAGAEVTFFPMVRYKEDWHGVRKVLDKRIEVQITAEASELRAYLRSRPGEFDAVLVCRPHNMESLLDAVGTERHLLGGATILYDAEALFVTRDLQKQAAGGQPVPEAQRLEMIAGEVSLTRLARTVISVSAAEAATLEDFGANDVKVLGYALRETPIATGFDERDQIVFLGAMPSDNAPNADAVRWFAADILPRIRQELRQPDLRLTVVGLATARSIQALAGDKVDLVGQVDDLPAALARARIMVVPTRFAAGIPLKMQQAAAMGIPLVATKLVAGQIGWQDGSELLVADDPAEFAAACVRLWQDADLWRAIRGRALGRVEIECSPERFAKQVREIVASIPIVHRSPEGAPLRPPEAPPPLDTEPKSSRPADADWSAAVPFGFAPLQIAPPVAVLCHLFHTEIAPEILFYLRNLPDSSAIFVSTDTTAKQGLIKTLFDQSSLKVQDIRVVPNRGRDIAPKLVGFADVYGQYETVLHLHSKMSVHANFLSPWRSYLFETLLGSPQIVRSVLDAFTRLPDLGMVAPQHFEAIRRWLGWNGNFQEAQALAARMNIALSPRRALDFPSGSMFWARPAALKPLLDLDLSFEDFPAENAQVDHTAAHAIERLYFHVCERSGHTWFKITQPALVFNTQTVADIPTPLALSQFVAEHGVMLGGSGVLPVTEEPAPMMTRVPPGLTARLASRSF